MKMNSLNIMIFGLIMNLLFGIIIADEYQEQAYDFDAMQTDGTTAMSEISNDQNTQAAGTSENNNEQTWGSGVGMFNSAWLILKFAAYPNSFDAIQGERETELEEQIRNAIKWFRVLYALLFALALYNFVKNRG